MRVVDTRHEQTATFAAEAYAKLTRRPGLAALTAGPGITNGTSAITSAWFNGSPLVVLGGRAPELRWGVGLAAGVRPRARDGVDHQVGGDREGRRARRGAMVHAAARLAMTPHRGPMFLDFPLDVFGPSARRRARAPTSASGCGAAPDDDAVARARRGSSPRAERPAFIVGSDVYWDGAWDALRAAAEHLRVPCFFNGLGRGTLPADHELAFLRTRGLLKARADLVVVLGTPLDFRLGFGRFGNAQVAHVVDAVSQTRRTTSTCPPWPATRTWCSRALADHTGARRRPRRLDRRAARRRGGAAVPPTPLLLAADSAPIKPSRIYGELAPPPRPRRGRDLRRRRLRQLRRQVRRGVRARAAGSTPARTAASATVPGYAIAARVGAPAAARSCCCSATAPPGSA